MTKSNFDFDFQFNKALSWVSLSIILVCLTGLVFIVTYLTVHEVRPIKSDVKILLNSNAKNKESIYYLNNYISKIEERTKQLNLIENKISNKIEEINNFYKFLGTIIAIVIAVASFFGFKSLHELKIRNLENAKEIAKTEAVSKVEDEIEHLKSILKSGVEIAKIEAKNETLSQFYGVQTKTEVLDGNINEIINRLDKIENVEDNLEDLLMRVKALEVSLIEEKSTLNKNGKLIDSSKSELKVNSELNEDSFDEEGYR